MHAPHSHEHNHAASSDRALATAFFLNATFTVAEIFGGYWTNSIAILTDALHDGGDCLTLGLAWYLQTLSHRRADAKFSYGYRRFSVLGALINGVVLLIGVSFVGWHATQRLIWPTEEEPYALGMLLFAALGIVVNGVAAWILTSGRSLNEQVASWHLLEDTFGWAAVLVGSIVMLIWHAPAVDPILALMLSVVVFWNVARNLKRVLLIFLQSAPSDFDLVKFRDRLARLPCVVSTHHTHTWTLDGDAHVFSTHLVMSKSADRETIVQTKQNIHAMLQEYDFEHITVEVELEGEPCPSNEHSTELQSGQQ